MLPDPSLQLSIVRPRTTSQSFRRDLEASESARDRWVEMDHALLLHRKPDDFVVVARNRDPRGRALNGDQLRAGRELESVRKCRQARRDLSVGLVAREPRLLPHRILELIETEIGLAEIHREVGRQREYEDRQQAPDSALSATIHHCDCAPSISVLTMRSIACFLPSGSPRSSYCPSASKPFRCQRGLPVTWSINSRSTTSCRRRFAVVACLLLALNPIGMSVPYP